LSAVGIAHKAGKSNLCREGKRRTLPKWLLGGLVIVLAGMDSSYNQWMCLGELLATNCCWWIDLKV